MPDTHIEEAITLMLGFARRTGLDPSGRPRRYLWTDAFAVCNFLGLARATGEPRFQQLARHLVGQVHHILGRHRDDDLRSGWISGLSEAEGEAHPTRGGLRIGKPLPERGADEPFDESLEWERDGQYFHYLTKWMQALDQVSRHTGDPIFNLWARELAARAYDAFTYRPPGGGSRMYWKMDIRLTRPQVASMGQHDPLDGYITCMQLQATATTLPPADDAPSLETATRAFAAMAHGQSWASADPLGIGALLIDAYRVAQLMECDAGGDPRMVERLLEAALAGLRYYAGSGDLRAAAEYRLAYRELGLAIGLQAIERLWQAPSPGAAADRGVHTQLEALAEYLLLGEEIETFWRDPAQQHTDMWAEQRDINEVMLATRLAPDGFLVLTR